MWKPFNLEGTLMAVNTPLLEFAIAEGITWKCNVIEKDLKKFPFEFYFDPDSMAEDLPEYFLDRLTPMSRAGIFKDLKKIGIDGYDPTKLLKYQNASCAHDCYWVRFKHGVQTWEALQEQIRTR